MNFVGDEAENTVTGTHLGDRFEGRGGVDSLSGGGGDDFFLYSAQDTGADWVDGGEGFDTIQALADNTVLNLSFSALDTVQAPRVEAIDGAGFEDVVIQVAASEQLDLTTLNVTGIEAIHGASGDETITGSRGEDRIIGLGGDDALSGGQGDDTLIGGAGDDTLTGGEGHDIAVFSGRFEDYSVTEDNGVFTLTDTTTGGDGVDRVTGVEVFRFLGDAPGAQDRTAQTVLHVAPDEITITAEHGADLVAAEDAESGAIIGAASARDANAGETLTFTLDDDAGGRFAIDADDGDIRVIGALDFETAQSHTITIRVTDPTGLSVTRTAIIQISDVSGNFVGSEQSDTLIASGESDTITGLGGDDLIMAGDGDDVILIGLDDGVDQIDGGAGEDVILATSDNVVIGLGAGPNGGEALTQVERIDSGGHANVTIQVADFGRIDFTAVTLDGVVRIDGGAEAEFIIASAGDDTVSGGAGNDTLDGGEGSDMLLLSGRLEDYTFETEDGGLSATDAQLARDGADHISGFETIRFAGEDEGLQDWSVDAIAQSLTTGSQAEWTGDAGRDLFSGDGSANTARGNDGDDVILLGAGNDRGEGGAGRDLLEGGDGDDILIADGASAPSWMFEPSGDQSAQATWDGVSLTLESPVGAAMLTFADLGSSNFSQVHVTARLNGVLVGVATGDIYGDQSNLSIDFGLGVEFDELRVEAVYYDFDAQAEALGPLFNVQYALDHARFGENDDPANGDMLVGGNGDDVLTGSSAWDVLLGGDGNDTIIASAGADRIDGGSGVDTLDFSQSASAVRIALDTLDPASAGYFGDAPETGVADRHATTGQEIINIESIIGSEASDFVFGAAAGTQADLGSGDDVFDTRDDRGGDDVVSLGAGEDTAFGGVGDDHLEGGDGGDVLHGGSGDDTLVGGAGADNLDGADGFDIADYSTSEVGVRVLLSANGETGDAFGDHLPNIEGLIGSAHDDQLVGDAASNLLIGGAGADLLSGGDGADSLFGAGEEPGARDFDFEGAAQGQPAWDNGILRLDAPAGGALLTFALDQDNQNSEFASVRITARSGGAVVGVVTADLYGDQATASIDFGVGVTFDELEIEHVSYSYDTGQEIFLPFTTAPFVLDRVRMGEVDEMAPGDTLMGGNGADTLTGSAAADSLEGGAGNDTFIASAGVDTYSGGDGIDTVDFSDSASSIKVALDTVDQGSLSYLDLDGDGVFGAADGASGDTFSSIENVIGSAGNDILFGAANGTTANLGAGNDLFDTRDDRGGDDVVDLGAGDDTAFGGVGNDYLFGGDGADGLFGGLGDDTLNGGAGIDNLIGGDGADLFNVSVGEAGGDVVIGGMGSWIDVLQLDGFDNPPTLGDDWTIEFRTGGITSSNADELFLSQDSSGTITLMETGEVIQFDSLEVIRWG